ncbi:unnamed protein product [Effrenium voratum]|nr:unnamed protein product [Effrenium voratum]
MDTSDVDARRTSPLLGSSSPSMKSVISNRSNKGAGDEMVRRLSEISTSSISFDASKLAMYKNFSGRSSYSRDLDGEAVGRSSRRSRTTGYTPSRAAPIAEDDFVSKLENHKTFIEKIDEAPAPKSRRAKTTVVSL